MRVLCKAADTLFMPHVDRRSFLLALGAGAVSTAAPTAAAAAKYPRADYALVLSGGGAKGAYEAGVIDTLASGIPDGRPLAPYGGVAGTSIGCLNGWFVSTGQYSQMRRLWMNVANEGVFRLKPEFAKIEEHGAGVFDRLYELLHLGLGVRKDVQGLCQTAPALDWIERYVDPERPSLVPFAWAATNLTRQASEFFYRLPPGFSASAKAGALAAFKRSLEPTTVIREVTADILHKAIFASACLPIVFDPVELPAADGSGMHQYCDGGVAANSPIGFAGTVARRVHVVVLAPATRENHYENAVQIGLAAYETMQRHIIYDGVRDLYAQTRIKRALAGDPRAEQVLAYLPDADVAFLRPQALLPVETTTFDDGEKIAQAYRMGMDDARRGFTPYDPEKAFA